MYLINGKRILEKIKDEYQHGGDLTVCVFSMETHGMLTHWCGVVDVLLYVKKNGITFSIYVVIWIHISMIVWIYPVQKMKPNPKIYSGWDL